ncbi:MAG: hypothetical protein WC780_06040 [Lentimicrobiaceae bacterium]|jgi:hypothetical protein
MEKQSLTPITDAAEKQLELRKQFFSDYSKELTAFFTDKIKSAFDSATQELEIKHKELMQQSAEMLQLQTAIIINPDEPTGK